MHQIGAASLITLCLAIYWLILLIGDQATPTSYLARLLKFPFEVLPRKAGWTQVCINISLFAVVPFVGKHRRSGF